MDAVYVGRAKNAPHSLSISDNRCQWSGSGGRLNMEPQVRHASHRLDTPPTDWTHQADIGHARQVAGHADGWTPCTKVQTHRAAGETYQA